MVDDVITFNHCAEAEMSNYSSQVSIVHIHEGFV